MSRSLRDALIASLLFGLLQPALADTIVCGTTLDLNSPLGWRSAKEAAADQDNRKALQILRQRAAKAAAEWPMPIATAASDAFAALDSGRDQIKNFNVGKSVVGDPLSPVQGAFFGQPYFVELPVEADSSLCSNPMDKKARVEFGTIIQGISDYDGAMMKPEIERVTATIAGLEREFDRYLFEGFPMFPWEAAVNSWFLTNKHLVEGPPRSQIVLVHPAAGLVASVAEDAKSDTGASLSIEPLGWVHYTKDYRHWMGVSALAVFPGDREPGYGVAFNYDMFKLGVTYHDDDTGEHDGAAVFIGLDLYKFLDAKYREYDGYRDRLRSLATGKQ